MGSRGKILIVVLLVVFGGRRVLGRRGFGGGCGSVFAAGSWFECCGLGKRREVYDRHRSLCRWMMSPRELCFLQGAGGGRSHSTGEGR